MDLPHPFRWLSPGAQRRALAAFLIAAVALTLALGQLGAPLVTAAAPYGIVSFELAGGRAGAERILESWDDAAKIYAGLNLGLDYLYLVAYSCFLSLGCVVVARRLAGRAAALGALVAWAQLAAGLLDAVENYALVKILLGATAPAWPVVARWCAVPKFLLVLLGLGYLVCGLVLSLVISRRHL